MKNKREKFVKLAEARVNKAIKDIRLVGNLANKNNYEYENGDTQKIFKALQKELDAAKSRFSADGDGKDGEFKL